MSDFPYTDDQVRRAAEARYCVSNPTVGPLDEARLWLLRLHEAGITVTFPEPRFRARETSWGPWQVWDRDSDSRAASFYGPFAVTYAREHAEKLNREVSL